MFTEPLYMMFIFTDAHTFTYIHHFHFDSESTLTQLCFLHEDLSEGPANPPQKGRYKHHDEALQVELGRLKCKHKQTTRDQHDHQDQEWVLVKRDRRDGEKQQEQRTEVEGEIRNKKKSKKTGNGK